MEIGQFLYGFVYEMTVLTRFIEYEEEVRRFLIEVLCFKKILNYYKGHKLNFSKY